ncbi:hypothetical protein M0R45_028160 [Rubus argutus]|uniref:Uncharacterized protein n=1 Tax=Rubus argutus TaxID=59490 RepID=A0AAW1W6V3_RUBAR
MAFSKSMAFFAIALVLVPMATFALDWPDISPSIQDEICKRVECGKGTCKFNSSYPSVYTCECDKGWRRTINGTDEINFLPCVIPECTLNYNNSCQPPPQAPDYSKIPDNYSAFDPCSWVYCGEGTCVKNATYLYTPQCVCNSGANNLLGVTVFPCYKDCTLTSSCEALGIKVSNSNSSSGGSDSNKATEFMPGKFQLMTIVMVSVGMLLWK